MTDQNNQNDRPVPGPYYEIGNSIYADSPQPVDPCHYKGFSEPENCGKYLIAESIPHKPTRQFLASIWQMASEIARLRSTQGKLVEALGKIRDRSQIGSTIEEIAEEALDAVKEG